MDRSVASRLPSTTRQRLAGGPLLVEAFAVDEVQAAQLVAFLVAMAGLLLALEIGLRRVHRRR